VFESRVESAWCLRLKLKCDELLSSFAFNFNVRRYHVVRINYANPDMVGHTGDLKAGADTRQTYTDWMVALELPDILPYIKMLFCSTGDSVERSA